MFNTELQTSSNGERHRETTNEATNRIHIRLEFHSEKRVVTETDIERLQNEANNQRNPYPHGNTE